MTGGAVLRIDRSVVTPALNLRQGIVSVVQDPGEIPDGYPMCTAIS